MTNTVNINMPEELKERMYKVIAKMESKNFNIDVSLSEIARAAIKLGLDIMEKDLEK